MESGHGGRYLLRPRPWHMYMCVRPCARACVYAHLYIHLYIHVPARREGVAQAIELHVLQRELDLVRVRVGVRARARVRARAMVTQRELHPPHAAESLCQLRVGGEAAPLGLTLGLGGAVEQDERIRAHLLRVQGRRAPCCVLTACPLCTCYVPTTCLLRAYCVLLVYTSGYASAIASESSPLPAPSSTCLGLG